MELSDFGKQYLLLGLRINKLIEAMLGPTLVLMI